MDKVRLALVGLGSYMHNTLAPILRNLPLELVAACDLDPEKALRFSSFYATPKTYGDFREMIGKERPDAVICATDAKTHYKAAKFCLQNSIDVFVEKTPCETSDQARELASLAEASGKKLNVGFNRRFATAYMLAKDIIGRPEFGKATMYYSKFNASVYGSNDYFVFNHIIHHLDLARYLLGEIEVGSVLSKTVNEKSGAFIVNFTTGHGAIGTIQCASMLEEAYPMERLDIVGTGGNIIVDNLRDLRFNRSAPARDKDYAAPLIDGGDCLSLNLSNGYGLGSGIFSYLGLEAELGRFVSSVLGNAKDAGCSIADCIGTMEAMEAVRKAVFDS
jgi:predicted dehydrogenase